MFSSLWAVPVCEQWEYTFEHSPHSLQICFPVFSSKPTTIKQNASAPNSICGISSLRMFSFGEKNSKAEYRVFFLFLLCYFSIHHLETQYHLFGLLNIIFSGVFQMQRVEIIIPSAQSTYHHWLINNFSLFTYLFTYLSLHFHHMTFSFSLLPISSHANVYNVCLFA